MQFRPRANPSNPQIAGSTIFTVALVAQQAVETATIVLTINDPGCCVCFAGGGKVEQFQHAVSSGGTTLNHQSSFVCCPGGQPPNVPVVLDVVQAGAVQDSRTVFLAPKYNCAPPPAATITGANTHAATGTK